MAQHITKIILVFWKILKQIIQKCYQDFELSCRRGQKLCLEKNHSKMETQKLN